MITVNLNPVLLDLGFFQIRWYSIFYIIGFLLTYFVFKYCSEKKVIEHLNKKNLDDLIVYIILGVVLGLAQVPLQDLGDSVWQ